jgi:hypothetical protein
MTEAEFAAVIIRFLRVLDPAFHSEEAAAQVMKSSLRRYAPSRLSVLSFSSGGD